ncbi:MAG: hypothetical protein ACOYBY_14675 [Dermatophilaceae bacterium]
MTRHPHSTEPSPPSATRAPAGDHRWEQYWTAIGNEDWQLACRLLDLSPRVRGFFASHLIEASWPASDEHGTPAGTEPELVLDWSGAANNVRGEGFSSTQRRLAELVLALVLDTPIALSDLAWLNEWTVPVWTALVEWATHGAATVQTAL